MVRHVEKRFELTIQDILNKQFHIDLKGYSANEVDQFLDCIIHDYQAYEQYVKELGENLTSYEKENHKLKQRIADLEISLQGKEVVSGAHVEHLDIVKRVSKLEQEVFKNR